MIAGGSWQESAVANDKSERQMRMVLLVMLVFAVAGIVITGVLASP